jgi:hypothetical protein
MRWQWKRASVNALLLWLILPTSGLGTRMLAQLPAPRPCDHAPYHQFDFWVGDWEVFEFGTEAKDAHVKVERILDGCVLHEIYEGVDGTRGESFSIYDSSRKLWHQTWMTNRGRLLMIEGNLKDGALVLVGSDLTPQGKERRVRGVWKPVKGGVRETAVTSLDGGKSWQPWFDLIFRTAQAH